MLTIYLSMTSARLESIACKKEMREEPFNERKIESKFIKL